LVLALLLLLTGVGGVGGADVVAAVGGDGCRARSKAQVGRAAVMAARVGERAEEREDGGRQGVKEANHRKDRKEQ
jgi:hypothetical protein